MPIYQPTLKSVPLNSVKRVAMAVKLHLLLLEHIILAYSSPVTLPPSFSSNTSSLSFHFAEGCLIEPPSANHLRVLHFSTSTIPQFIVFPLQNIVNLPCTLPIALAIHSVNTTGPSQINNFLSSDLIRLTSIPFH